jgi:thiamine pyrophosphate-dependent acetolactate synthase large subunit-like protein
LTGYLEQLTRRWLSKLTLFSVYINTVLKYEEKTAKKYFQLIYPVHECVKIITRSKKPVMVVGSQALVGVPAGERAELMKQVVEDIGIPCYLGGMARGLLGRHNKLLMRHARRDALKEADCIILAGKGRFPRSLVEFF